MIDILIVQNNKSLCDTIKLNLCNSGYNCTFVFDGKEAADIIENKKFDLTIIDAVLPTYSGFELIEYIKNYDIPVIMLIENDNINDKIKCLKLGADNYITKPFREIELLTCIETILQKYKKNNNQIDLFDMHIDTLSRIVTKGGKTVNLTNKEYELLLYFIRNKNIALYRSQLSMNVWGYDCVGTSRTVDLHVQRMRKKLGLEGKIVPIYKVGYRLQD